MSETKQEVLLTLPSVWTLEWLKVHSHGVVWKRPDGIRARCLGPANEHHHNCEHCTYEQMIVQLLFEMGKIGRHELTDRSGLTSYAELDAKGQP